MGRGRTYPRDGDRSGARRRGRRDGGGGGAPYLTHAGFEVEHAADGPTALAVAARTRPDLVVLDLMLPGLDGLEVCRRLRRARPDVAVVMLTALGEESDRVVGLEIGADDYVAKPFSPRELVLRVRSVLRRSGVGPVADGLPRRLAPGTSRSTSAGRAIAVPGGRVSLTAARVRPARPPA